METQRVVHGQASKQQHIQGGNHIAKRFRLDQRLALGLVQTNIGHSEKVVGRCELSEDTLESVPIWLQIHNIPSALWSHVAICKIGSSMSTLISAKLNG